MHLLETSGEENGTVFVLIDGQKLGVLRGVEALEWRDDRPTNLQNR